MKDDIEGNFVFLNRTLRPPTPDIDIKWPLRSQLLPAVCLASRKRVALGAADLTFYYAAKHESGTNVQLVTWNS